MPYVDNDYPNVDNFPVPSFRSPIPAPLVDPTEPDLIYVAYNVFWGEVLGSAVMALLQPSTWAGSHDDIIAAQNRANNLAVLLQTPAEVGSGQSPFWDDENGDDADGSSSDNSYTWSDRIEDWAIAAFVASSGVPGAAVAYLTIAPKFRLLFRQRDYGGIVKIFLDALEIGEVDTYGATPATIGFDVVVPAAFARNVDPEPHEIKLLVTGEHNPAATPNGAGQYPVDIIRKRLFPEEIAVTTILRQNPDEPCILEQSFDGGDTWEAFADLQKCPPIIQYSSNGISVGYHTTEGFGYYEVPDGPWIDEPPEAWFAALQPTPAMQAQTNEDCVAAANAVNVLWQTAHDIGTQLINVVGGQALALFETQAGLALIFGADIAGAVSVAVSAFFAAYQTAFAATDFSDEQQALMVCVVLSNLSGTPGTWTVDYAGVFNGMAAAGITSDVELCMQLILNLIGSNGLNLATKTTQVSSYDCSDCPENFTHTFDFEIDNGSWTVVSSFGGSYTSGQGWVATTLGANDRNEYIERLFSSRVVTSISATYSYTAGPHDTGAGVFNLLDNTGSLFAVNAPGAPPTSPYTWTGSRTMTRIGLFIAPTRCSTGCTASGASTISRIVVKGQGSDPF